MLLTPHNMFFRFMVRLEVADVILESNQRQGRYSFYMRAACEEAIAVGSSEALTKVWVFY